jgi:hydroxymethylpyrimidine/phosphomethylpyrimidine kinase
VLVKAFISPIAHRRPRDRRRRPRAPARATPVGPTHGTGCTLSAAIAAELARGLPLLDAVRSAKDYVGRAIAASLALGRGSRVLDHGAH